MNKNRSIRKISLLIMIFTLCSCLHQGPLNLVSYKKQAGVGYSIWVDDDYAYIANNDGVDIFDIHQPKHPQKMGEIPAGNTFGVYVKNGMAYISGEQGLSIVDISNPIEPNLVGEYPFKAVTNALYLEGDYIYLASEKGLDILDVRDPARIIMVSHFSYNAAKGVAVNGEIVYLASANGVVVIDVTDPVSPQKIKSLPNTNNACDVHVNGDHLYVGRHDMGISIFTIHDPGEPHFAGNFLDNDDGEALGIWGDTNYLFIADNYGIEVLDITNPIQAFEIDEYSNVRGAHDIHVNGNYVYAATASKGLLILEFNDIKDP